MKSKPNKSTAPKPVRCSALLAALVKKWEDTASLNRELCKMLPSKPDAEWLEAATAALILDDCAKDLRRVIAANDKVSDGAGRKDRA